MSPRAGGGGGDGAVVQRTSRRLSVPAMAAMGAAAVIVDDPQVERNRQGIRRVVRHGEAQGSRVVGGGGGDEVVQQMSYSGDGSGSDTVTQSEGSEGGGPGEVRLAKMTLVELRRVAKERNLKGYSKLKKAELVEALSAVDYSDDGQWSY
eukprot:4801216-Pyramimonas_sp.AAC.1